MQPRRDQHRVGVLVGEDQDFAGTGDGVDGHLAEHQALGAGDIGVARAEDLVDPAYLRGAIGERSDGLSPPCVEEGVDTGEVRGREEEIVRIGGGEDDILHAGDARGDGGHQDAGRVARLAPRSVDADARQRAHPHAQGDAVLFIAEGSMGQLGVPLPAVEALDASGRKRQAVAHRRIEASERRSAARVSPIVTGETAEERAHRAMLEALHVTANGGVALGADSREDLPNRRGYRLEVARAASHEAGEGSLERRRAVGEDGEEGKHGASRRRVPRTHQNG